VVITYPARLVPQDDGRIFVEFVDLPDTFTEGVDEDEALFNASEALSGMLSWHIEQGDAIPEPTHDLLTPGVFYIAPDAKTQAALLLRTARGDRSVADVARALETSWPAAKRLEDARHWPSLKTLDKAARVLGKRLVLSFE
jgi:antitoxin HicB